MSVTTTALKPSEHTPDTNTRNLVSVDEAGARQWLLDNPNVISANIHDAFTKLIQQNPSLAGMADADIRAATENYNQFLMQKLSKGASLNDAMSGAGNDTFVKNPALAQALNNDTTIIDLEIMESMRRNNGFSAADQADHYTYDRDFYAEQQAKYVADMANYIATYSSHKEMNSTDLKDMLDGYGVPEEYHERIAVTLEDDHDFEIAGIKPVEPEVALAPEPEATPEPKVRPAVYQVPTSSGPGMGMTNLA